MKILKNRALQEDLTRCASMLGFSIYVVSNSALSQRQKYIGTAGLLLVIAVTFLEIWRIYQNKHMTPEEQREAKRENNDERSQMIQTMATRNSWWLEDALLLIALVVFLVRSQPEIYCVLYVVLVIRELACTGFRWWLERKY